MTRIRSRSSEDAGTKLNLSNGVTSNATRTVFSEHCIDVIGNYGGIHPLTLRSSTVKGGRLNGQSKGVVSYVLTNYPIDGYSAASLLPASIIDTSSYINAALARTGLNTPITNLPLFIAELKDIPHMLKHAGDVLHLAKTGITKLSHPKQVAAATLAYQFGWAPLISDLRKLISFQDQVEKRRFQIDKAFNDERGYRGKAMLLLKEDHSIERNKLLQSSMQMTLRRDVYTDDLQKVWASVTWKPSSRMRQLGYDAAYAAAFRSALGLNARNIPLTVWKVLPWSWFVDWFANCSDYLLATNNLQDYVPSRGCIMVNTKRTISYAGAKWHWSTGETVTMDAYVKVQENKERFLLPSTHPTLPPMKLPIIDNFKLSVLGSLAILKIAK